MWKAPGASPPGDTPSTKTPEPNYQFVYSVDSSLPGGLPHRSLKRRIAVMNRRDLMNLGIAATMAPAAAHAGDPECENSIDGAAIILIHGANHGGWCWRPVADRLRNSGFRVFTPTLTGLGERKHLRSPDITLNTHIDDIVNVIHFEELDSVVLVAHSYGGTVLTGVCDRMKDRVSQVIFLDANAPTDGQPTIPGLTPELAEKITGKPLLDGYLLPALDPVRMGVSPDDARNTEWLHRNLTEHPLQTLTEPIHLENGGTEDTHRTFILATPLDQLQKFARDGTLRIKEDPSWHYEELLVGHDAMVIAPNQTADLLKKIITDKHAPDPA
jgi:pimeloyl-ACP methyl ester carboxylesterase